MTTETSEEHKHLVERTEATLEKFQEKAEGLRGELPEARAATKVQLKAMIARLEKKYDMGKQRLSELGPDGDTEEIGRLHQKIVADLHDMVRTIERRILYR